MSENKENHPFDEEALRHALNESLQSAEAKRQGADAHESEAPLFGRDALTGERGEESPEPFDADDGLNYGDLMESWQEGEEAKDEYLPEDEEESGLEQADDEPIRTFPEAGGQAASSPAEAPANTTGHSGAAGLSRIVIGIIALSAVGFTISNWMTSQKANTLAVQVEGLEVRLNTLSQEVNRLPAENSNEPAEPAQASEAMLAQITASIVENREAIDALRQSLEAISTSSHSEPGAEISAAAPAETAKPAKQAPATSRRPGEPARATAKPAPGNTGPGWSVVLISLKNETMADEELAALLGKGIQAEKHTVQVRGETYHQLRTGRFGQKEAALAYSKELAETMGYKGAWVSQD